jgi:hypothetical protein
MLMRVSLSSLRAWRGWYWRLLILETVYHLRYCSDDVANIDIAIAIDVERRVLVFDSVLERENVFDGELAIIVEVQARETLRKHLCGSRRITPEPQVAREEQAAQR